MIRKAPLRLAVGCGAALFGGYLTSAAHPGAHALTRDALSAARPVYPDSVRRPRGIYAVVVFNETGAKGNVDLDALLSNPAVSGLALRVPWSELQPAKSQYDFSRLDSVFALAVAKHKTVQLILLPGFGTPSWVLDELPSCDAIRVSSKPKAETGPRGRGGRRKEPASARGGRNTGSSVETASAPCGKQTFSVSEGARHGDEKPLPLPWNPVYKAHWKAFLTEVASRFGANSAFVSIAVTGPTATSAEIILPRSGEQLERWAELLEISYRDPSYHRSDKAFVEEWAAAVSMYGEVFRHVTLIVTRGSGLPNFDKHESGEAQATILSAFGRQSVGSNAKATQTSGLKACRDNKAGIRGVKEMSADAALSPPVLGGAQFDTSFSQRPSAEGCAASCDSTAAACKAVTPSEALANVLAIYFDGTPAGDSYRASAGPASLNYLQIYAPDIVYAAAQPPVEAMLERTNQRLLSLAR